MLRKRQLRFRMDLGYTSGEASWCHVQRQVQGLSEPVRSPLIQHGPSAAFLEVAYCELSHRDDVATIDPGLSVGDHEY